MSDRKREDLSSTNSTLSTNAIEHLVEKLRFKRHRSSTRKNYYCVWKSFNKFYLQLDRKPRFWDQRLTLFVAFLINEGKKSTTIKSYISAIKAVLREDGHKISEDTFLLASLTKACRFKNNVLHTRLPTHRKLLEVIIQQIRNLYEEKNQHYLAVLYSAVFMSSYYGLL